MFKVAYGFEQVAKHRVHPSSAPIRAASEH